MNQKEKLKKINKDIEKTENRLRRAEREEKILQHQLKTLNRKERTHRLCTRGAMLERYLPQPEILTDEQVNFILKTLFNSSNVRQIFDKISLKNQRKPEEDIE